MDIRQLQIFHEIYKKKSVSRAAEVLDLGQPTVSIELNKLRKQFNDQLFVRVGNTMEATDVAIALAERIGVALSMFKDITEFHSGFDPLVSQRQFCISMTDISHMEILPRLLAYLQKNAPNIKLEIVPIDLDTPKRMADGNIDLAIGFIPQLEAGFYQQTLFHQHYVCLAGQDHARIQGSITLEDYRREHHIDVASTGTGHFVMENVLKSVGIQRNIVLRLPSYLGMGILIESTQLIASVPVRLSQLFSQKARLQLLPLPFTSPEYTIKQHWHARFHQDSGSQWLRRVLFELASDFSSGHSHLS